MTANDQVFKKVFELNEMGKVFDYTTNESVVEAAKLVKKGVIYDLGTERYHGMPVDPIHPPFNVLSYRSPKGLINQKDQAWLEKNNDVNLRVLSEVIYGTMHTGTHIDGFAHITCGFDNHWYNNFTAENDLGDNGPLKADGAKLLPIFGRGVLLDVPKYLGMEILPKNYGIDSKLLKNTAESQGIEVKKGDTVLIRTGYMKTWPDPKSQEYFGSGINLDAAKWLSEVGVVNVGGDNESLEQDPTEDPNNPHPVHTFFLIEKGIHIMEYVEMESLSKDNIYEFLFISAPLTVRNATGSMINPLAII
ncbi:cyclase family protein [Lederbergia citrea]|uniref:cyclase family protein n=1 Tax=Lederbergia citrea TaxID=2833581 RepID=UPI001BC9C77B|nr:cyclase family protein [Lederbergia citrea]MBS4178802.1 cyclase family protein [Lederbergia citrea]